MYLTDQVTFNYVYNVGNKKLRHFCNMTNHAVYIYVCKAIQSISVLGGKFLIKIIFWSTVFISLFQHTNKVY
jgi:hypothetical protein